MTESKHASADDEIKAIIDEAHEAGVGDAMEAYELAEKLYFEAVAATVVSPTIAPATNTTPGPPLTGATTR